MEENCGKYILRLQLPSAAETHMPLKLISKFGIKRQTSQSFIHFFRQIYKNVKGYIILSLMTMDRRIGGAGQAAVARAAPGAVAVAMLISPNATFILEKIDQHIFLLIMIFNSKMLRETQSGWIIINNGIFSQDQQIL